MHAHIRPAKTQSGRSVPITARSRAREGGTAGISTRAPSCSYASPTRSCLAARASKGTTSQTTGAIASQGQIFSVDSPLTSSNAAQADDGMTQEADTRCNTAPRREVSSSTSTVVASHTHQEHSHVAAPTVRSSGRDSKDTSVRRDRALERKGMANATAASRTPVTPRDHLSRSVHPSVLKKSSFMGSTASTTTTPSSSPPSHTIGAGDETEYWDYQHRRVEVS